MKQTRTLLCGTVAALTLCFTFRTLRPALAQPAAPIRIAANAHADTRPITFRFVPPASLPNVRSVNVAGAFNRWNREANPLTKAADGAWTTTLLLEPGVYQYKFVVNGAIWLLDPNASGVDDGNGNTNSRLLVQPADYDAHPAQVGDGQITASGVQHLVNAQYVQRRDKTHLDIRLRTRAGDVQTCQLVYTGGTGRTGREQSADLTRTGRDELFDTWQTTIAIPINGRLRYHFILHDSPTLMGDVTGADGPFAVQTASFPPFETPEWARDAVFYQIFPERFANGDPANDGPNVQPWGATPTFDNREGGDLQGVTQHLDYLNALGINALYFNPIFASRSNHGYDTNDYHHVDARFGGDDALKTLTRQAHAHGWHIILDGVFNHTSVDFPQFADLRTRGADSPYKNWYFVHKFPLVVKDGQDTYEGWFGTPWLPKINVQTPDTRAYLLDVATRWIKDAHIDGWRLDAADEVEPTYWQTFRKTVRKADPNAYIVGEIWGNAQNWLQGDQFDSVMNYRWRGAVLDFFASDKSSPSQFNAALSRIYDDYPPAASQVMFNILDSHDTERIRTTCRGEWPRQRQAALFQMTYPGTPCLYYGDEIGMEGGRDPDNRRAMQWDATRQDKACLTFYQQTLALRKTHPTLRRGAYKVVAKDDATGVFGYVRTLKTQTALVLFNRSDQPQTLHLTRTEVGAATLGKWLDTGASLTPGDDGWTVNLPARGVALLGTP